MSNAEWNDHGISITYPNSEITEYHTKGAISFLLTENKPVTIENVSAVLPDLFYLGGVEFYRTTWNPAIQPQVDELHDKIFPPDADLARLQNIMHPLMGVPKAYAGFTWIMSFLVAAVAFFLTDFAPLLLVALMGSTWVYGYFRTKKDPYFFEPVVQKMPRIVQKILPVALAVVIPLAAAHKTHAGMVVTDPTSYSYYVEQIKEATKQLETLQEQLETAQDALKETQEMKNLLEGTFNHAMGTIEDLKKIQKELKEDPTELLKYAEKFLADQAQGEEWINPEDIIGDIFVDPRKTENQMERIKQLNEKFHMRQKTFEQAILKAEKTHEEMPDKYARIEEIAAKIDTAQSTKEAMDINNQLLAEILRAITDLVSLTGYIGEAQAMAHFKGVDDAELEKAKEELKETEEASKGYTPQKEYLDKQGISLDRPMEDEMMRILGD